MRRRISQSSLTLATALACLAATASAAVAGGWVLPATTLAPIANGPSGAVVAVDSAGDAVAAWTNDDGIGMQSLLAATRAAGGAWSRPATLASRIGVDAPSVAIDGDGQATVVWIESADGSAFAAHAARGDAASGRWDAATAFTPASTPTGTATADPLTQVRIDAAGTAVAAWVEHDPDTGVAFVQAAVGGAGGWSAPATLSDPADASVAFARPQIAPNASGGAIVGWTAQRLADPFDYAIQTSAHSGGGWSAPADLVSSGEAISPVQLVGVAGGEAAATWFQGSPSTLWGALRTGGSWTVDDVSDDVAPACVPLQALGADAGSGATVVWKAQSTDGLESVRLTAGGWEPSTTAFASATESAEDATIDHGTLVLVAHDAGTDADSVLASRRDGSGWSTPPALLASAGSGTILGGLDITTDAAGDALSSWTSTDPLGGKAIAAAAFQAGGPQLSDVDVPASAAMDDPLALSVSARSAFATVAQTTWDFGDGSPLASGTSVSHAYAAAGSYTVTITATDSVGNATQARRQVTVASPPPTTPPGGGTPPGGTPPVTTPPGGTTPPETTPPGTTAPPSSTPTPTPPAALVRPRIGGAPGGVLVLGRGSRTLKPTIRNPNGGALHGMATLARPRSGSHPALTLASRRRLAFAGGNRRTTLTLQLTDQALRALQRASGHRLPIRLTLRLRAADGRLVTATLTATLDAAARFVRVVPRAPLAHRSC